ncbi:uncharacterized protein LOC107992841 isoform X1 [Apis cerana]|uniref:uncharacterized protein LOC107992841 isoform X1 n=2 Tax=Apis cerana TaxID=7461 RepID=UPI0007E2CD2F|nr:uncharacterized protein LOC107992841 isoform X1 [Apis cerana]XP_061939636.1 uncharacterized protein LOC107992841 isoform X1 [Apis cerana]
MKFICSIYILFVIFAENKEKFFVQCIANIKENELIYLSNLLNPVECLQLVQAIYEVTPMKTERRVKKYETLMNKDFTGMSTLSKECLLNLEEWSQDFPTNARPSGRTTMEMILRWLGRPDLAKYVRENRESIDYFDTENLADTLEFPGHRVSKRHTSGKDKNAQAHKKNKKKKKKRKQKNSKTQNKKVGKAVAATGAHAKVNKNHHDLKKKDNRHSRQPNNSTNNYIAHTSMYCSILLILFFITICLVAAYYFYKRNSTKARGTRFKHMRRPKEDKDTFTDYLEWKDEIICSCTDMEECCTGECSLCKENDYKHHVIDRRTSSSDDSIKELNFVVRKPKKKEKKRKRFTFFQSSCQNKKKEKEQEYRDRKKILENMMMKKHEKLLPMLPNDVCCKCCKCTVYIRDKILREKKAKEKKARKKKEEKRRKKEKLRKAELRANNVCFRDICK